MITQLLTDHKTLLDKKQIYTAHDLIPFLRLDFEKIVYALLEIKNRTTFEVMADFFSDNPKLGAEIATLITQPRLYHIGFQINEPLDMVIPAFDHWLEKANAQLGIDARVSNCFRFPASQASQNRMGAYVEIMRLWLTSSHGEMMLELFDIHRHMPFTPIPHKHRLTKDGIVGPQDGFLELFRPDEIWHYALLVDSPQIVTELHERFGTLAAHNKTYQQAYSHIVNNKNDGSFYTKIINQDRQLELEFVTENQY